MLSIGLYVIYTAYRRPEARGYAKCVETDTEWYNRLVPWAMWPFYSLATIVLAIKSLSVYQATVQTIVVDRHWSSPMLYINDSELTPFLSNSSYFLDVQNHSTRGGWTRSHAHKKVGVLPHINHYTKPKSWSKALAAVVDEKVCWNQREKNIQCHTPAVHPSNFL